MSTTRAHNPWCQESPWWVLTDTTGITCPTFDPSLQAVHDSRSECLFKSPRATDTELEMGTAQWDLSNAPQNRWFHQRIGNTHQLNQPTHTDTIIIKHSTSHQCFTFPWSWWCQAFLRVTGGMTLDFGHWENRCRHFGASCHVFLVNIWSWMVLRQIPNGIIPLTYRSPLFTACPPVSHRHTVRCDDGDEAGEAWSDEAGVLWRLSRLWAALGGHLQDMNHVTWGIWDASVCTPIEDMYNIIDYLYWCIII